MKPEQLRGDFYFFAVSGRQDWREELEDTFLKEGFNIELFASEEALMTRLRSEPPHVVFVDLMGIEWKLKQLIEEILSVSPETLFIFSGPEDLFDRTRAYRDFGLFHYVAESGLGVAYCSWIADLAISHIYSRYQNEQLILGQPGATLSLTDENRDEGDQDDNPAKNVNAGVQLIDEDDWQVISRSTQVGGMLDAAQEVVAAYGWKLLFFKFVAGKYSLVLKSSHGINYETVKGVGLQLNDVQAREYRDILMNLEQLPDFQRLMKDVFGAGEFVSVPVFSGIQLSGIVVAYGGQQRSTLDEVMRTVLLSYQKISLQQKLDELSVLDEVTQLLTPKYYRQALADELSRSRRLQLPFALLLIRVDNYHKFNAEYGDDHASILIQSVANVIAKTSRVNDVCARTADDEIKVLLPHTHLRGAGIRAERLRRIIEQSDFPMKTKVSISVGVSEYPSVCRDSEGLEQTATKAIKQVLDKGGNKVCLAAIGRDFKPDFKVETEAAQ